MTPEEQKRYDYIFDRLRKWESLGIAYDDAAALLDKCTEQCEQCEAYTRAEQLERVNAELQNQLKGQALITREVNNVKSDRATRKQKKR